MNLYWSLADVWQVLTPLVAFRTFKADVVLSTHLDLMVFLAFGWLLNNVVGAAWGASMLAVGGVTLREGVPSIFTGWFVGNLIVTIAITPLSLRYGTRYLHARGLLVHRYWI